MRELGYKVAFGIALAAGIWVFGFTLLQALTSERLTAARMLTWTTAGQPLEPGFQVTCEGDPHLRTLLEGEQTLWSSCLPGPGLPSGSYVRYRPADGTIELDWPAPDEHPLAVTEGLRPGPDGQLAVVYRDSDGGLVAGIAGDGGWHVVPMRLTAEPNAQLLGIGWEGYSADVVWAPSASVDREDGWNEPRIQTLHADGTTSVRELSRTTICDARWRRCGVQAAYRQPGARVWRLLVSAREPATLWNVVETGIRHPVEGFDFPWDARDDTDLTASGLLIEAALRLRGVFTEQGEFQRLPGNVVARYAGWSRDYTADDGSIAHRPHFAMGGTSVFVEQPGAATAGVEVTGERANQLLAYQIENGDIIAQELLGRITADCVGLASGALIPTEQGGHWLVSPSGCVMGIGPDVSRTDELGLVDHLRTGGSTCASCSYVGPVLGWAWVMLGLPICVGIAALIVVLRRRGSYRMVREPLYRVLILPVLAYDVSAALLLIDLLPMLQ